MEKRIQEFIADYIPKRVTKETRYKLQAELENHIYERIDYYTEVGYSEEESLEKALKDFGDDKETKEQIKKEMSEIHRPFTSADFFYISIPITIALIFIGGTLLHIVLFKDLYLKIYLLIPMVMWLLIIAIKKSNKIHHILKSIIAFVLVVPYFVYMFIGNFFFTETYEIDLNKNKVLTSYSDIIDTDSEDEDKHFNFPPRACELGDPIDVDEFSMRWDSIFGESIWSTSIIEYSPTEYKELKNKFNEEFKYMANYEVYGYFIDDEYIDEEMIYKCDFSVYGFDFRTIEKSDDSNEYYDYWYLIGTNDETHEIAFIKTIDAPTPTFNEHFIKEDCGWRYFYYMTKF